jgi:hypothetical protein
VIPYLSLWKSISVVQYLTIWLISVLMVQFLSHGPYVTISALIYFPLTSFETNEEVLIKCVTKTRTIASRSYYVFDIHLFPTSCNTEAPSVQISSEYNQLLSSSCYYRSKIFEMECWSLKMFTKSNKDAKSACQHLGVKVLRPHEATFPLIWTNSVRVPWTAGTSVHHRLHSST